MFTVEADIITNRARELALSGKWAEGQRFMLRCLQGMTAEDTWKIMSGENHLVSTANGVDFSEQGADRDEDIRYREIMEKYHGNALRTPYGYYRPYAYVTNYGIHDIPDQGDRNTTAIGRYLNMSARYSSRGIKQTKGVRGWIYACRPVHYMNDPETDIIIDLSLRNTEYSSPDIGRNEVPVIFRKTDEIPPWVEAVSDAGKCLADYLSSGGLLEERGHAQMYGITRSPIQESKHVISEQDDYMAQLRAEQREHERRMKCDKAREAVLRQIKETNSGWLDMPVGDDGLTISIPKLPFMHWCLDRVGAGHLVPEWNVCSEPGLKMGMVSGDDPMHTDWMLGAGIDPLTTRWYGAEGEERNLVEAAGKLMSKVQSETLNFTCAVLSGTGAVTGNAWIADRNREDLPEPGSIVVLPDAGIEWTEAVTAAVSGNTGGVIVSRGGAMAHLVVNSRADNFPIVMVKNATRLYTEGQLITLDCSEGNVLVHAVEPITSSEYGSFGL